MSVKSFKLTADGNFAVDGGTIKFQGTILLVSEDTGTEKEINMKALKIKDDEEEEVTHVEDSKESPAKSVNLLEESDEEGADTDTDTDKAHEDDELEEDNDDVPDMRRMSTNGTKGSKILFHHDFDVDDDYELSQTISGFGY